MKTQDAFRAQYFLASIENASIKTETSLDKFPYFSRPIKEILCEFSEKLCIELDQILLPTIVFEIDKAKQLKLLSGHNSVTRYASFFVKNNGYTDLAKMILEKYSFLFEMIDNLINHSFDALLECLKRFENDILDLKKQNFVSPTARIDKVLLLEGSDRHRNQQSLLLVLSDGLKIIYKPVNLKPDLLFNEFVKTLDLKEPFNLRTLEILIKSEYGWIKYIDRKICHYVDEIKFFYCRMGMLLAVADALNYTDGHCENLIADGVFPILIDGETFFQNYGIKTLQHKNILTTLLLQKVDDLHENYFFSAALQVPHGKKFAYYKTHPINDHTDDIEIRYFGIDQSVHHHCPILIDKPCYAYDYIDNIIEGYCVGYQRITQRNQEILSYNEWWEKLAQVHARVILRDTITYLYLIRKIQQPEGTISRRNAEQLLRNKLGETRFTDYEVSDLLELNVPYFYHIPGQRHLFNGRGHIYSNIFDGTSLEKLRSQFLNRSVDKMHFDCQILKRHLIPIFVENEINKQST